MSPIELEAALRSILLKLQYTKAILRPTPKGKPWAVCRAIETIHNQSGRRRCTPSC